jgi:O-antigen/teichoic acid export membrane protein
MFMNFLNFFILWSDILVMGMFRPAAEVGIYAIASRLATGVSMPTDSLGASLAPSFSSLTGRGDTEGLRRLFHTSTRWIFLLSSFAGLGLVLAGHPILGIFGHEFQVGYAALCLLAGGQMVTALFGANGTLITMTGHPRVNLANSIVLGVGNLGLNLLLVPRYGPLGAASAAAISWAVVNTTRAVEIWFILKIGPWDRTMAKPLLCLLAGAALGGAVMWAAGPIPATLAGLGAFALAWWALRPEPEDADMLRRGWSKLRGRPAAV